MRKLKMFNLVTVDGFFAGQNGEIDWHNVDAEFNEFAIAQVSQGNTLLFGRVTYQLMEAYWPTPSGIKDDPIVAKGMNDSQKIVFSRTLKSVTWGNTTLLKGDLAAEIKKLKAQQGTDIVILGSGSIVSQLAPLGLIDEYNILVNPVVLGRGKPLFKGIDKRLDLKLLATRAFKSGNVLITYAPKRGTP